eukprot:gene2460-50159_t
MPILVAKDGGVVPAAAPPVAGRGRGAPAAAPRPGGRGRGAGHVPGCACEGCTGGGARPAAFPHVPPAPVRLPPAQLPVELAGAPVGPHLPPAPPAPPVADALLPPAQLPVELMGAPVMAAGRPSQQWGAECGDPPAKRALVDAQQQHAQLQLQGHGGVWPAAGGRGRGLRTPSVQQHTMRGAVAALAALAALTHSRAHGAPAGTHTSEKKAIAAAVRPVVAASAAIGECPKEGYSDTDCDKCDTCDGCIGMMLPGGR